MPTIATRIQRLLKKTDRMKQEAVKGLLRTLKHIDQERKKRTADLEEAARLIGKQLANLGHQSQKAAPKTRKATATKKNRKRRSPEAMKAEADKIVKFIRSKGKEGAAGSQIKAEFGPYQSVKQFVKEKKGVTLKTKGQRAAMRYFVD